MLSPTFLRQGHIIFLASPWHYTNLIGEVWPVAEGVLRLQLAGEDRPKMDSLFQWSLKKRKKKVIDKPEGVKPTTCN